MQKRLSEQDKNWTTEVAATLGETTRALAAAEIAVKEAPTLDGYRRAGTGGRRLARPS
jgi:hypothetical protein